MRDFSILLRLELRSLFGLNKLRYTRDPRARRRGRLLLGVAVLLCLLLMGYIVGLCVGLSFLGLASAIPLCLSVAASLVVLILGMLRASAVLFSASGYDLLASMPLSPRSILLSRLAVMYLEEVLFCAAILLPGCVTYGVLCRPTPGFYLSGALGCLLLPALPMVASTLLGTLIAVGTARLKHKSLLQALLLVAVVVGVSSLSFTLVGVSEDTAEDFLATLLASACTRLASLCPPAAWLSDAMLGVSPWGLVWFSLASLSSLALGSVLAAALFPRIMRSLSAVHATHDYTVGALSGRSVLGALYVRECKRYASSSIYIANTVVGPILAVVLSVAVLVMGVEDMEAALPIALPIRTLLPCLLSAVLCMMTTASVSVSLEGKQMEVIRALPIPPRDWLGAKLLLSLTLLLPAWLVSEVLLTVALRPAPLALVGQLLLPLALVLFSAVLGITVDLKFHRFDWEREEMPVKQSLSAGLGGFAGALVSLAAAGLVCLSPPARRSAVMLTLALLLTLAALLLHRRNGRVRMEAL